MIDISIFLLIAGMAFFFFLAPSKNFKQAFQAIAFVLFLTLAIICFSTEEFTFTETLIREIEHSAMLAAMLIDFSDRTDISGWSTTPQNNRPNNLIVDYNGRTDTMLIKHKAFTITQDAISSDTYASKTFTMPGPITEIAGKITVKDIRDTNGDTVDFNYWAISVFDTNNQLIAVYGNGFLASYSSQTNEGPVFNSAVTWRLDLQDRAANEVQLRLHYYMGPPSGTSVKEQTVMTIDEIVINYEEPTISTTETETRTHPILVFGDMNIAIGFIFVFLAMINLMIFMIDVVTWKRKTNSKTL